MYIWITGINLGNLYSGRIYGAKQFVSSPMLIYAYQRKNVKGSKFGNLGVDPGGDMGDIFSKVEQIWPILLFSACF